MEDNKELFRRIREINMVEFLSKIGIHGMRQGRNYAYKSPLRDGDSDPSFKVHATKSIWKDWGDGTGGNIFDFGARYFGSVGKFLKELRIHYPNIFWDTAPVQSETVKEVQQQKEKTEEKEVPEIKVLTVKPLYSFPLLNYLKERRIPRAIADQFCKEVTYELKGKTYFAIGFKNSAGGFALRNRHMKQATVPNDVTFIKNDAKEIAVFEGFFDFLSYKTMYHNQDEPKMNYLILNSTSFFEKSLPLMQEHRKVHLFLDNDNTGKNWTILAQGLLGDRIVDERSFYKNHKDLNEFHRSFGLNQKARLNQKF
jgi:DNA primase